jgi:hypothetical protein
MRRWLAGLLVASFANPRGAVREVVSLQMSARDITLAAVLAAVLLTLANWIIGEIAGLPADPVQDIIRSQPLVAAVIQLAGLGLGALISLALARLFGGTGSLADTLMVSIWLIAAMTLVQLTLLLLSPLIHPVLPILLPAVLVWSLYAYASGMAEIHGFRNVWAVMAVMLVISAGLALVMAMLAERAGLGLSVTGNV